MIKSFSVIVPAFNCEKVIERTVDSINESIKFFEHNYSQSKQVKSEIIVVNDASKDQTTKVVSWLIQRGYPVKLISHEIGRGAGAARNTGVKHSNGEILFFCDGDDLFLPQHIYVCYMILNHEFNPQVNLDKEVTFSFNYHGNIHTIKLPQKRVDFVKTSVRIRDRIHPDWKQRVNASLTINLCVRRECHDFINGYPEDEVYVKIRGREDCAYNQLLTRLFDVARVVSETVEYVRYPDNSFDQQYQTYKFAPGLKRADISAEEMVWHQNASQLEKQRFEALISKRKTQSSFQFTNDWFSINIPVWRKILKKLSNLPDLKFLEIGSWEGRSTCWLLDNILTHKSASITCIDTFCGSIEHNNLDKNYLQSVESRFDFNIKQTGSNQKVTKIVGTSQKVLKTLPHNTYDFLYIDGSHIAPDVLEDAILGLRLVKVKGLIVFDDYNWPQFKDNPTQHPKLAVDAFLNVFKDKIKLIHQGYQVIVEKVAS